MTDPAIIGKCRVGHVRIGSLHPEFWEQFKNSIEKKIPTPGKMCVDGPEARVDVGEWRVDGFTPQFWTAFKKQVENV